MGGDLAAFEFVEISIAGIADEEAVEELLSGGRNRELLKDERDFLKRAGHKSGRWFVQLRQN
jgi:hypothetical protein